MWILSKALSNLLSDISTPSDVQVERRTEIDGVAEWQRHTHPHTKVVIFRRALCHVGRNTSKGRAGCGALLHAVSIMYGNPPRGGVSHQSIPFHFLFPFPLLSFPFFLREEKDSGTSAGSSRD
jgi:hypothetical protein